MQARFLTATNGAQIAYAVMGSGPPLVFVPPWTSHLEALWALDGHRRFCERLAERHTLVIYDRWGCGLSDRDRTDFSLDADVAVLADVVAHLRLRRFALFGPSAGGAVSLAYADRAPQQVTRVVLFGMSEARTPPELDSWPALRALMLTDWPLAALTLSSVMVLGARRDETVAFAELLQACATPEMTVALMDVGKAADHSDLIDRVRVPTLVIGRRGDPFLPPERSRRLAARIEGAELVLLDGDAHILYVGDVDPVADAVLAFTQRGWRSPGPAGALTAREREILDLVAGGLTNASIAARLVLSVRTVERHTLNIYAKLGVRGRAEAVAVTYAAPEPG